MIKKLIFKVLRIPNQGTPVIDVIDYPVINKDGYSGNSLIEKNILYIVASKEDFNNQILRQSEIENCNYEIVKMWSLEELESFCFPKSELGHFDKIINIIDIEHLGLEVDDYLYFIYHLFQIESDYIIENKGTSITTALLTDDEKYDTANKTVVNMMKGLGLPIAGHSIIFNSLRATQKVPKQDIIQSLIFLSSKYGYELNGETLYLGQ